nr:hypothetical protein [Tanacetum cinerariifolium]
DYGHTTVFVSVDSSKESFRETIKIGIDVTHYLPVTLAVFLASTVVMRLTKKGEAMRGIQEHLLEMPTQEELRALRDRADVVEVEGATLRATIRTMGVFKMSLRNRMRDKRHTRNEIECQLDLVQEELTQSRMSHSQDRQNFNKLKDFMTIQCGSFDSCRSLSLKLI